MSGGVTMQRDDLHAVDDWLGATERAPFTGLDVRRCDGLRTLEERLRWHARSIPSANGGLCSSFVTPSVAYGASPIFRRAWGWQRTSSARASRSWLRAESWNRCRLRTAVPTGNMP